MKLAYRLLLSSLVVIVVMGASVFFLIDLPFSDIAIGALSAALAAVLLAVHFARSVSQPIRELRDVARAMADGDVSRRPAISATGEVGDLAGAISRLSEQLGARVRALQEEETLVATIVESLNEGVLTIGPRQMVLRINSTARKMLGVENDVPFPVDYLPREGRLREAVARALGGHATRNEEVEIFGKELALEARPLAQGAVLALFDLSEVRRLDAVRRDFVANASHELRTPLTIVRGFAETLADKSIGDTDRLRFASLILANTERMQRIVDELLDLSRIESGGWTPRPTKVDFRQVGDELRSSWLERLSAKKLELTLDIPEEARWLEADKTALLQVMGNLVENAFRHTTAGEVRIFSRRGRDGQVSIGVADTGTGIAPEHLPRIFERFYRAEPARERSNGGVGLGLSIVKHLVDAHGGTVRAESVPGKGTTVTASFANDFFGPRAEHDRDEIVT